MKYLLPLFLALLSSSAFAGETADADLVYYDTLINIFFNVVLTFGFLFAFVGLGWISWIGLKQVLNPNLAQQEGRKPMSVVKYAGGLAVISILAFPLSSMELFNDLSGFGSVRGMCVVVDVNVSHFEWANEANECISYAEEQLSTLAEYTNRDHIESANIGLLFGAIQLVALSMFLGSAWMLIMHVAGMREVKLTVSQALLSMFMATVFMALPNAVSYIDDFKGSQNVILDT